MNIYLDKCPVCGNTVRSFDEYCNNCSAVLKNQPAVPSTTNDEAERLEKLADETVKAMARKLFKQ